MDAGPGNHTAVTIKFQYSYSTNVSWSWDTRGHSPSLLQWAPCLLSTCNLCLANKGLVLIRSPGNSAKVYRTICPVQEKLASVKSAAIIFQECFQTHRESPRTSFQCQSQVSVKHEIRNQKGLQASNQGNTHCKKWQWDLPPPQTLSTLDILTSLSDPTMQIS